MASLCHREMLPPRCGIGVKGDAAHWVQFLVLRCGWSQEERMIPIGAANAYVQGIL